MEAEYTKIDNDLAVKARFLYNELRALDDLMLTIPYHPEKMYLLEACLLYTSPSPRDRG